jgi:hypothetical protein
VPRPFWRPVWGVVVGSDPNRPPLRSAKDRPGLPGAGGGSRNTLEGGSYGTRTPATPATGRAWHFWAGSVTRTVLTDSVRCCYYGARTGVLRQPGQP